MRYVVENSDLFGEIKNFTVDVVQEMVDEQRRQGNYCDVTVFQEQREASKLEFGFDWDESIKGDLYWIDIMKKADMSDIKDIEQIYGIF